MQRNHVSAYRSILRELKRASTSSQSKSKTLHAEFRSIVEKLRTSQNTKTVESDIDNAITFMRSQREHKALLERYNPLHDLTAEERIHATARRVGLDMPVTHDPSK